MYRNLKSGAVLVTLMILASVAAQTFQYSRGWTNGKRSGRVQDTATRDELGLERVLSPCQIVKIKYILEGKPLNEKILVPCDYSDDLESAPKGTYSRHERNQEQPFEPLL